MKSLRRRRLMLSLARDELRLRSSVQRGELLQAASSLRPRLAVAHQAADGARAASDWLRAHPGLALAGAAGAVLLLRPRRLLGWASTLAGAWSLWRRLQPLLTR